MPFYKPKKTMRKKTYYKRRRGHYRPLKPNRYKRPSNQITRAKFVNWEAATIGNLAGAGVGVPSAGHLAKALSDLNGCAPYIQLFSQYRVRKIKYQFIPITGAKAITDSSKAPQAICSQLCTSINRVATSFPQDMEQIFTMGSKQWTSLGRYHARYFKPCTYDAVFRAFPAGSNALNPEYDQWISTNYANVAQHGLSYVIGACGDLPANYYKYRVITTMYCEFKNRRVNTDNLTGIINISGTSNEGESSN